MTPAMLKRFLIFGLLLCLLLTGLTMAFAARVLSAYQLAVGVLMGCAVGMWILTSLIRQATAELRDQSPAQQGLLPQGRTQVLIWVVRGVMAFLLIGLTVAVATLPGAPILPEITGIAINICMLAGCLSLIKKLRTREKR